MGQKFKVCPMQSTQVKIASQGSTGPRNAGTDLHVRSCDSHVTYIFNGAEIQADVADRIPGERDRRENLSNWFGTGMKPVCDVEKARIRRHLCSHHPRQQTHASSCGLSNQVSLSVTSTC